MIWKVECAVSVHRLVTVSEPSLQGRRVHAYLDWGGLSVATFALGVSDVTMMLSMMLSMMWVG